MTNKKVKAFSTTLDDCRVDTFCSGGKGGQHQNATKSGVRITHIESGAVGECREERYQHTNKVRAFVRMAQSPVYVAWAKKKASEVMSGKSIEQTVDELLLPRNLKTEIKDETGKWKVVNDAELT